MKVDCGNADCCDKSKEKKEQVSFNHCTGDIILMTALLSTNCMVAQQIQILQMYILNSMHRKTSVT